MKFQEFMEKSLLMELYQQYHTHFAPLTQKLKKIGFNLHDSLILLALFFESQKPVTPGDLERVLHISKDQISQSLKRLEQNAMVQRKLSDQDKRKRFLEITAKGKRTASLLVKSFDNHEASFERATEAMKIAEQNMSAQK